MVAVGVVLVDMDMSVGVIVMVGRIVVDCGRDCSGAGDSGNWLTNADLEWIEDQVASLSYTVQIWLQEETSYLDFS